MSQTNVSAQQAPPSKIDEIKTTLDEATSIFAELEQCSTDGLSEELRRFEALREKLHTAIQDLRDACQKQKDIEVKLRDARNVVKDAHEKLQEKLPSFDFRKAFSIAAYVESCAFSRSFCLPPLAQAKELGYVEQRHSKVVTFDPLSKAPSDHFFDPPTLGAKVVPFHDNIKGKVTTKGEMPKWEICVDDKPYLHVTRHQDKIEASWDEQIKDADMPTAHQLLFSVVVFNLSWIPPAPFATMLSLDKVPSSKSLCCQLLRPGTLKIMPPASTSHPLPKRKTQPRQHIATVTLQPILPVSFDSELQQWLTKQLLAHGELEMNGYGGDANFKKPEEPSQLPSVELSANPKDAHPDWSQASGKVSLFENDVELVLFETPAAP